MGGTNFAVFCFPDPRPSVLTHKMIEREKEFLNEYEVREDEEQNFKLQEIIDLLVAAGYFRARIKGLSAFDKVVGGIIWSMDSCNFDVNVDLLFLENSTIGQKIALTEKIVVVLPKMDCPHMIEPHQIQGLDFIHIFPIIQWLVKRSVKVREERKEFIRNHALIKFKNQYDKQEKNIHFPSENVKKIQMIYRRRRIFKRKLGVLENKKLQVDGTLFEYGFPYSPFKNEVQAVVQNHFLKALEFSDAPTPKIMGNIVNSQAEKIAQISQQFFKLKTDIDNSSVSLRIKHRDIIAKKKDALNLEEIQLREDIEILNKKNQVVQENLKQFDDVNPINKNHRMYEKLQGLILLEESLKKQEATFRDHCRAKLEMLQNLLKDALEKNHNQENSTDNRCEEEKKKVQILKLQIAKKNRSVALIQRQLDEIPGRGELAQYQRRFLELYNEVAQKHEETKQFYTLYNTLDDTKLYLSKELSLLNSVLDNYSDAMSNAIDKEEFMTQFESIVSAIKQNKQKIEKRKTEERNRRDKLSQQLLELVEQQRNYVNIVKQLRIECKKNEELLVRFRKQI